jgi:protein-disulfide isomerase
MHPDAPLAHLASMAANEQGKFWEFNKKLFSSQPKIKRDDIMKYAQEMGLDMGRFEASINAKKYQDVIDADAKEAESLGANGTPAFFVNGRFLNGAKPFEEFAKVINAELKRQNLPVPTGAANVGG